MKILFGLKKLRQTFPYLLLSCLLIIAQEADAQKIHALIFADLEDDYISNGCNSDVKHIRDFLSELAKSLGKDDVDEHDYLLKDFSASKFNGCYNDFQSSSTDIIFLYISSHGDRASNASTEFPDVRFPQGSASAYDLFLKLVKAPHRSCIGIIDACNEFRKATPGELINYSKGGSEKPAAANPKYKIIPANVKNLFIETNFDMLITGSQTGVDCITNQDGSVFTASLVKGFEYLLSLSNTTLVTIDIVLDRIKYLTLIESTRQISNHRDDIKNPRTVPYYPMWRICSPNEFPCDPGTYFKSVPEFIDIGLDNRISTLRSQIDNYVNLSCEYANSLKVQTKDVDLQQAELQRAQRANENFDLQNRFDSKNFSTINAETIRDVSPNQFVLKFNPIALTDSMKKSFGTSEKFLVSTDLIAPTDLLNNIDHVDYHLDPDLPVPVITNNDIKRGYSQDIFLSNNFYLVATITFRDNTNTVIGEQIILPNN